MGTERVLRLAFAALLSLTSAACVSSAPATTAGRAFDALKKGNLPKFRDQLTPKAQTTLGTQQEMDAIRQKLGRYTNLSLGPPLMASAKQGDQGYGHYGDVRRTYKVTVAASAGKSSPPQAIYTLVLKCLIGYDVVHYEEVAEVCSTSTDANGTPWTNCVGGTPAYNQVEYGESCAIAKVEEEKQENSAE
jgi:hypothetical protein